MVHSKLKYPIGLLSENIQESIIGGLAQEKLKNVRMAYILTTICIHADWQKRRASIYYFHVM
jgi:hypothetical protein